MATSDASNKIPIDTSKESPKTALKFGSIIRCTDVLGKVYEGEVLAFDPTANFVILS